MLEKNTPKTTQKEWSDIKGENSWTMFKVVSEFVESFDRMNKIGPCISIFGSARTKPEHPYYQLGVDVAKRMIDDGYGVITGGGPGIMEAANKGAFLNGGASVGLSINLPKEQGFNKYIDMDKLSSFNYFFVRKVIFVKYAQAFVVLPGGFGTLDELFEVLTLIQTKKISRFPVILVGKKYWEGMMEWIKNVMLEEERNVNPEDLDLVQIVETPDEVSKLISDFYGNQTDNKLEPNFNL